MSDGRLSQSQIWVWQGKQKQWALASEDTCLLPPGRHIVRQTPQLARSRIRTVNERFSVLLTEFLFFTLLGTLSAQSYVTHCLLCVSVPDTSSLWL